MSLVQHCRRSQSKARFQFSPGSCNGGLGWIIASEVTQFEKGYLRVAFLVIKLEKMWKFSYNSPAFFMGFSYARRRLCGNH